MVELVKKDVGNGQSFKLAASYLTLYLSLERVQRTLTFVGNYYLTLKRVQRTRTFQNQSTLPFGG